MAKANDQQMQDFVANRFRKRMERLRALIFEFRDDVAAIPDVWQRASEGPAWTEQRSDGPPRIMQNQNVLEYNTFLAMFLKQVDTGLTQAESTTLKDLFPLVLTACVRAVDVPDAQ
jgi:hypothetical protein